jgi:hypothetical protein
MLYSKILAQCRLKGTSAGKLDAKKQICKTKLDAEKQTCRKTQKLPCLIEYSIFKNNKEQDNMSSA